MARKKASQISVHGQYFFDQKKKQFHTSKGVWLTPIPIPGLILERLLTQGPKPNGKVKVVNEDVDQSNDLEVGNKPAPPKVEVDYGKGRKGIEENPNDPDHLAELNEWELKRNVSVMMTMFNMGIAESPPESFVEMWEEIRPDFRSATIKYMWVLSAMTGDEESAALSEIIMGQTLPTAEGVAEAEESFPGDGGDESD